MVSSGKLKNARNFATRYGFADAVKTEDLWQRDDIDTVYILGPNSLHCPHLEQALKMTNLRRVYIEKPVCVNKDEENTLSKMASDSSSEVTIQCGFQYLQMPSVRRALEIWNENDFGNVIHFHARYLHSGYLKREYREKRTERLKPAPEGGALSDLGAHIFSLLVAFLGERLEVVSAIRSGAYQDVPPDSDLCTTVLLRDTQSVAAGTVVASRISAGAGDVLELEIRAERGALRLSTERPDELQIFAEQESKSWQTIYCGNDYSPVTAFPSPHVSAGWLRSLVHAHYLFLGGTDESAFLPDLRHGLVVQRLIRRCAELLIETS